MSIKRNFKSLLIILLIAFIASMGDFSGLSLVSSSTVNEVMFEPLNAIQLEGYSTATIPYIAGYVSDEGESTFFDRIDIYKIVDDQKIHIGIKEVNSEIPSTYGFTYLDYSYNEYTILYAEPYLKQDELTGEYYICYDDTLKQAIGFAHGKCPDTAIFEANTAVYENVFFSMPIDRNIDGSHIELDLENVFGELTEYSDYVLILDGIFKASENDPIEYHYEKEVTIYYMPELAWGTEWAGGLIAGWKKGDGHLHSSYSDGKSSLSGRGNAWISKTVQGGDGIVGFTHKGKNCIPVKDEDTIAWRAKNIAKMDWIIMTDHADYLYYPQQHPFCKLDDYGYWQDIAPEYRDKCCQYSNTKVGEERWFKLYKRECATAETTYGVMTIPMEEITVCNKCPSKNTDCLKMRGRFKCGVGREEVSYGDILNYFVDRDYLWSNQHPKKGLLPNKIWSSGQVLKKKIHSTCTCTYEKDEEIPLCAKNGPPGLFGWNIIAHPYGSPSWDPPYLLPELKEALWFRDFDAHQCPSVIRSYYDNNEQNSNTQNDQCGFFGMELSNRVPALRHNNVEAVKWWDSYLFSDVVEGKWVDKWNYDGRKIWHETGNKTGNNFVIGVANSDQHFSFWQDMEDLTVVKASAEYIPIPDLELREIPHFPQYLKADLRYLPLLHECTYVKSDAAPSQHEIFLKDFRSCGKGNGGVTASFGGGWATFSLQRFTKDENGVYHPTGSPIPSGNMLVLNPGEYIGIFLSALVPWMNVGEKNYIDKVIIKGACAKLVGGQLKDCRGSDPPWQARTIDTIQISTSNNRRGRIENEQLKKDSVPYYIPYEKILENDYIRIEVNFNCKTGYYLIPEVSASYAYCNPVLIHKED